MTTGAFMGTASLPHKVLFLVSKYKVSKYKGDYGLLNSMVLGLDPMFEARVCYISVTPDNRNTLDGYGKTIYVEKDEESSGLAIVPALVRILKAERPFIECTD